nr:hypothetical protein [Myxococcota bacterium]
SLADARAVAFELEARMIVGVAVWMGAPAQDAAAPDTTAPESAAPESVALSLMIGARTFSATREVGEGGVAAAAQGAMHDVRAQQTRAMLVEGPAAESEPTGEAPAEDAAATDGAAATATPATTATTTAPVDATPAFDVIGPTMLGAFGAAGLGLGVYSVLDGTCEQRGAVTGVCLRGEDPNLGVGITLMVAGTLALAGAIVWLATGAAVIADQPRIDMVLGPEGGAVSVRGTF